MMSGGRAMLAVWGRSEAMMRVSQVILASTLAGVIAVGSGPAFAADSVTVVTKAPDGALTVRSLFAANPEATAASIGLSPRVVAASRMHTRTILSTPDGAARDLQWPLNRVNADDAWQVTKGEGVVVAVVDTGIDGGHPDLRGSLVPGFSAFKSGATRDPNGHGTHVAGTIVAHGAVTGIAPGAKIMPIRVMGANGIGNTFNIVRGLIWAVNHGADIINMSIGSPQPDQSERAAVQWARSQGVLVVAAAGNAGTTAASYPAAYDDYRTDAGVGDSVIGVGALDRAGQRPAFSNRGHPVDISAPGVGVLSTYTRRRHAYSWESGSSMATPFVAGTAALALAYQRRNHPEVSKLDDSNIVDAAVRAGATDLGRPGVDLFFGWGEVSAAGALAQLGAPTWAGQSRDLSIFGRRNGHATVAFTPPQDSDAIAVLTSAPGAGGARGAAAVSDGITIWHGSGGPPVNLPLDGLSMARSYAVTVFAAKDAQVSRSVIGLRPLKWAMRRPTQVRIGAKGNIAVATTLPRYGVAPVGPITIRYRWANKRKTERVSQIASSPVTVPMPQVDKHLAFVASVSGGYGNWPSHSRGYRVNVY